MLQSIRKRVRTRLGDQAAQALAAAESELVGSACSESTEQLKLIAEYWRGLLDPDGAEPADDEGRARRAFRLGALAADGTAAFSGRVGSAEDYALIRELLASRRRTGPLLRTPDGGDDAGEHEDLDGEWRQAGDPRTRTQQDYDTALDTIRAGLEAEASGTAATATVHEVVVHVTADELERRGGAGWTEGVLGRIPVPAVERIACIGGVRLLVSDRRGEPLHLGRSRRLFSAAQRKALSGRTGGRCEAPGCTVPAPYLQAHHIAWYGRDGGRTDIGNAILLCSHHHHAVHATQGGIDVRRWRGSLWVTPRGWLGPPLERHRCRPPRAAPAA